jgi:transcriptional regulator with XRE-family HTH domain
VDDQRLGAALRAVRIRRHWTQAELATRCGVSGGFVSLVERGHLDAVSLRALRRLASALEVRLEVTARTRGGDMDRLLNAGHAAMHEEMARHLSSVPGWLHAPEVSFSVFGERGVIDSLAFHPDTGSLVVIELKTALVSVENLLTTMDIRLRLASRIARERGWPATTVSGWIVIADSRTNRRRVAEHSATLRSAFPSDGRRMRAWLRTPAGAVRALSFWSDSNPRAANRTLLRGSGSATAISPGRRPNSSRGCELVRLPRLAGG